MGCFGFGRAANSVSFFEDMQDCGRLKHVAKACALKAG